MTAHAKGRAAAEPWRAYFALQLRFAEALAEQSSQPLAEVLTFNTNFHRQLGYGNLASMPPADEFLAFVTRLEASGASERAEQVVEAYAARPPEELPAQPFRFGCFSFDPPDTHGRVRIHFGNRDSADGVGPLAQTKLEHRRAELTAMFRHVVNTYPHAETVVGGSWAYHLERYRRLFPPAFTEARKLPQRAALHGSASWGQFLDFRGRLKTALAEDLTRNLTALDLEKPWLVFPLPMLVTNAPIGVFVREYAM